MHGDTKKIKMAKKNDTQDFSDTLPWFAFNTIPLWHTDIQRMGGREAINTPSDVFKSVRREKD